MNNPIDLRANALLVGQEGRQPRDEVIILLILEYNDILGQE